MTISIGDMLPNTHLQIAGGDGPIPILLHEYFLNRRIVLFGVPGAFTPTCSAKHLPGYLKNNDAIKEKGIDKIVCLSVNDAFVMGAWAKLTRVGDKITMLCDGNAEFVRAVGLDIDATRFGMGMRSQRFAAIINNLKIEKLFVERPGEFKVSSAEYLLTEI